jgi:hypothetical protein
MENQEKQFRLNVTRRHFLTKAGLGFGSAALGSMLFKDQLFGADAQSSIPLGLAQYAPKAKRIIYLFQNGAPSQLETFDYKPLLNTQTGFQELDYVTAIPICYCKPGFAADIINNIENYGFDPKVINYDIDRYIVKRTENSDVEKFVLFANYQFNV